MATTAFTTHHGHTAVYELASKITPGTTSPERNKAAAFIGDLLEDVLQKPLQPAALAKHDMFREHILAMSISYFALIVVLIAASLPVLAYLVSY
jgi:hypothetical protein